MARRLDVTFAAAAACAVACSARPRPGATPPEKRATYRYRVEIVGKGHVVVKRIGVIPDAFECRKSCALDRWIGQESFELVAVPAPGWVLDSWGGWPCEAARDACRLPLLGSAILRPSFRVDPFEWYEAPLHTFPRAVASDGDIVVVGSSALTRAQGGDRAPDVLVQAYGPDRTIRWSHSVSGPGQDDVAGIAANGGMYGLLHTKWVDTPPNAIIRRTYVHIWPGDLNGPRQIRIGTLEDVSGSDLTWAQGPVALARERGNGTARVIVQALSPGGGWRWTRSLDGMLPFAIASDRSQARVIVAGGACRNLSVDGAALPGSATGPCVMAFDAKAGALQWVSALPFGRYAQVTDLAPLRSGLLLLAAIDPGASPFGDGPARLLRRRRAVLVVLQSDTGQLVSNVVHEAAVGEELRRLRTAATSQGDGAVAAVERHHPSTDAAVTDLLTYRLAGVDLRLESSRHIPGGFKDIAVIAGDRIVVVGFLRIGMRSGPVAEIRERSPAVPRKPRAR